jgi:hypoxanthine phosphoribosyltransferase
MVNFTVHARRRCPREVDPLAGLFGTVPVRVHSPAGLVRADKLSIVDVERAMERMTDDAREFRPSHIAGINRGGAIIGGWLAKQLELEAPTLLIVNSDQYSGRRVTPCLSEAGKLAGRIYLVDDAQRKGEHMREAVSFLTSLQAVTDIRRAVMLQMHVPHQGPEAQAFRLSAADFAGFTTKDSTVTLPWDR